MNKLFSIILFALIFPSCTNKNRLIGKWRMVGESTITINFIDDSTGSIKRFDTSTSDKPEDFKYHIQHDTLFEHTPAHLFKPRKWEISKLDKDSLVINLGGITRHYYHVH